MKPIAIDAFCGAGGLSKGLASAGFRVGLALDNDHVCVTSYRKNIGDHIVEGDVSKTDIRRLLRDREVDPKNVALFAGGPPCQGFSIQRRGEDNDERNTLVESFLDQALSLRPPFVLLENVLGLKGHRGKALLDVARDRLTKAGYIPHISMLNAADYGVAQTRRRMFIVGEKAEDEAVYFEFPKPEIPPEAWKTVREAIGDLPSPPADGKEHPAVPNHRCDRLTPRNRERFSHVPQSGGRDDIPEELRLACHKVSTDKAGHRYVYGRLAWDKPAGVITARFDSLTRGRFGHPSEHRTISLREGARLQGFEDDFVFLGTKCEVARQIGNAVPPPLARALGTAILEALKRRKQRKPVKIDTGNSKSLPGFALK